MPSARFTLVKVGGATEERVFQTIEKLAARSDAYPKEGTSQDGSATFADPTNKKYPIDREAHVRAARAYINMPKNAAKHSSADVEAIKGDIEAAAKMHGMTITKVTSAEDLAKGLYDVGTRDARPAARVPRDCAVKEALYEQDVSALPAMLTEHVQGLAERLRETVDEETAELAQLTDLEGAIMENKTTTGAGEPFTKAHLEAHMKGLAKAHKSAVALHEKVGALHKALGDTWSIGSMAEGGVSEKVVGATDDVQKTDITARLDALEQKIEKVMAERDASKDRERARRSGRCAAREDHSARLLRCRQGRGRSAVEKVATGEPKTAREAFKHAINHPDLTTLAGSR